MTFLNFLEDVYYLRSPYGIRQPRSFGYKTRSTLLTIFNLLTKPQEYHQHIHQPWFVSPILLLIVATVLSYPKFKGDMMSQIIVAQFNQHQTLINFLYPIIASLSTAVGAYWIPRFWHQVLGIQIDRTLFIKAMISIFAAVAIPFEILSWCWYGYIRDGIIPFWLPDLVRTLIVTLYSWLCGSSLQQQTTS